MTSQTKPDEKPLPTFGSIDRCPKCATPTVAVARDWHPEVKEWTSPDFVVCPCGGWVRAHFYSFARYEHDDCCPRCHGTGRWYMRQNYAPEHLLYVCRCGFTWRTGVDTP